MTTQSAVKGMFWKTLEQYGVMGFQFVIQIILARIIEPQIYGIIAVVIVFIALSNVFIQSGFSIALVQSKKIEEDDVSSVFCFSLIIASVFYIVLFFFAPIISTFFKISELTSLVRVMAIGLFPGVYSSIQNALLRREINFKAVFVSSLLSVVLSGAIGILLALFDFGVWALVIQYLLYTFSVVITQYLQIKWKPKIILNIKKLRKFYSFGWKVLVTNLINELFVEMRSIVIGRFYTGADLSFFSRGKQFPSLLMQSVNGSLQAVLLPKMAKLQDDTKTQYEIMHKTLSVSSYIMFPLLMILALSSTSMVSWMLTDKWLPCVIYIQLHCLYFATWPITTTNNQALLAIGKSGVVLKVEAIRKMIDATLLLLTIKYGVVAIAIGAVATGIISLPIYLIPSQNAIGYRISWQINDVSQPFMLTLVMGIAVWSVGKLAIGAFSLFCLQWTIGLLVYIGLSVITKNRQLKYVINVVKSARKSKS